MAQVLCSRNVLAMYLWRYFLASCHIEQATHARSLLHYTTIQISLPIILSDWSIYNLTP